ncbi:MAG: chromosome segregation protein SMC [Planctomycetaceae bacterium]
MLKSLELFGFKSFADRTKFDFDPGITGVVGPNGSGKSNIVDAIKWILGDQSAKSLRGEEMTDVIFNGTAGRRASNFAEASVTFDNSGRILPIDMPEVQVGRRLWRSGESEYLINNAPARLKDVRDLFMGTGAGRASYCIIEQGRVDQILQANATSRRGIFEEAAGVSRYKARKIEAEKKLERVDQNVLRLTDIVDEIEAQLNSVRNQAQKAAKYREVAGELKRFWLGLAADDFRHQSVILEELERAVAEFKTQSSQLSHELQDQENELAALDRQLAGLDDRLRDAERQSGANRESIASHEATVRHQTAREHELDSDLVRLRKQRTLMAARAREILGELEHVREQKNRFEAEFAARKQNVAGRRAQVEKLATQLETARRLVEEDRGRLLGKMKEVSSSENRVAALMTQSHSLDEDKRALLNERKRIETELTAVRVDCDRQQGVVEEAAVALRAVERDVEEIEQRRQELMDAQNRVHENLAQQRERRSACRARKSVLEDLELRQEGLGIGVKEILRRAGELDGEPWSLIRGSVADLLEVDLEQAALLEVALGSRAQLIVIDNFAPLIDYLNSGAGQISGRVGFIACTSSPATRRGPQRTARGIEQFEVGSEAAIDLSGQPGIEMRADRIVRSSTLLPELPARLLADTWIVDTLDSALRLSRGIGRGCRFVTLQGELLDSDGTLTVGTVRSELALVSRKSELRRLRNDLNRLERDIVDEENRLAQVDGTLDEVNVEIIAAETELQQAAERHGTFKSLHADLLRDLEGRQRALREVHERDVELEARGEKLAQSLLDAQADLAAFNQQLLELRQEIERHEQHVTQTQQQLTQIERQQAADQLDLAKKEERLIGMRTACQRIEQDQQQREQQREEVERRLAAVNAKRHEIKLHILNTSATLSDLYLTRERSAAEVAERLSEKTRLRDARAGLQEQINILRAQRRELDEAQHQHEIRSSDVRHQIATLQQRITEEYQMSLAEVVNSAVSAYADYQRERLADRAGGDSSAANSTRSGDRHAGDLPTFVEVRGELEERVSRLRRKLQHMGSVNVDSLHDLDELEGRFGHLREQLNDLVEAKRALEEIIRRINQESKRLFVETFEAIRAHFQTLFRKAFGGGDGDIVLEDPDDVLECGIDVVARPPGKELKSISLMSGGEKTLTALALLLALFKSRPSPYCLLDEADAALDEANVGRMLALLEEFKQSTQFILVTHKKPTMTVADVLYGVTMEESGVSKKLSVRFEDVRENGDFSTRPSQRTDSAPGSHPSKEAA